MKAPNLASRPALNTRPVWLVIFATAFVSLVLLAVNLQLYRASNRALSEKLVLRDQLELEKTALQDEVRQQLAVLDQVPWRTLTARVGGLNVVLREHGFSWLTLLGDVERVMPYQTRLTRIGPTITPDGIKLNLNGVARTREAMLEFFENLIADGSFADTLPRAEMTPEEGEIGYSFILTVDYHPRASKPVPEPGSDSESESESEVESEAVLKPPAGAEAEAEAESVVEHEAEARP